MKHKLSRNILGVFVLSAARLVRHLPPVPARKLGAACGRAAHVLLGRHRAMALSNAEAALAGCTHPAQRERIVRECFVNAGRNAFELLSLEKKDRQAILSGVRIDNEQVIKDVLSRGKGAVIVSAHLGNWELLGAWLSAAGYRTNVLARIIRHEPYNRFVENMRCSFGMNVIYKTRVYKRALRCLGRNELLGVLADQDIDNVKGVFLDFLGHPAYTPAGAAEIARLSGAGIIPCFILNENAHHRIFVEDAIPAPGNRDEVIPVMERCNRIIEKYIRQFPSQWVWFHPRWKTAPRRNF